MSTLLLRLAAPLQSWGSNSKFETRTTEKMPTKSGVIGMLASALGWTRNADLTRLTALKFGVRADREGENITDFHIARVQKGKDSYVTYRHYLSDAVFLAGVEGDEEVIKELEIALHNPCFPLFLGRRSCPPTLPIVIGVRQSSLEKALREEPPICENDAPYMRIQIEMDDLDAGMMQDVPISFDPQRRIYGYRKVKEFYAGVYQKESEHDAMAELG